MAEQYEVIRYRWVVEVARVRATDRRYLGEGHQIDQEVTGWEPLRYFPNEIQARVFAEEEAYEYGEVQIRELE